MWSTNTVVLIAATALLLPGCFQGTDAVDGGAAPDGKTPGTAGAPCKAQKKCDTGLTCLSGVCVLLPDLGRPDLPQPDTVAWDAKPADVALKPDGVSPHQIVITELMPDPQKVNDAVGEWFEIYNLGGTSVELKGWTIVSGKTTHVIKPPKSSLKIKPNQYLVLGLTGSATKTDAGTASNGGVPVDYVYYAITLGNTTDSLGLKDDKGRLVDQVSYDNKTKTSWPFGVGVSMSLRSVSSDNAKAASWCAEKSKWSGSLGDSGSPGAAQTCGL